MTGRVLYSAFMLLGLAVFVAVRRLQPRSAAVAALPRWQRWALAWAALVGAAIGGKVGYALAYNADWLEWRTWLADGKTVTLALVGAYLGVELIKLALHIPVKTGDTFALPLALALAVGRWGCYCNGCCYGVATDLPWGVDFFGDGVRRHPTQVYESLFHFVLAGLLIVIICHDGLRNQRLKLYLIAYAAFRFVTEYIRPEPVWALGLTFYQWVCLLAAAALAVQWIADARAKPLSVASNDTEPRMAVEQS
jgi:phosphatidylglycerol---prolipoprotein diacylglyceryl transferase